jgi:hypothetical protein
VIIIQRQFREQIKRLGLPKKIIMGWRGRKNCSVADSSFDVDWSDAIERAEGGQEFSKDLVKSINLE